MQKYKTEIYAYETTPYCVKAVEGGWVVHQSWWGKNVSPVFASKDEAETELVAVAKANRAYRPLRRRVKV